MASKMTTTKKVKIVGTAEYTNNATGEVERFDVIEKEERDFNFHKLWLGHILQSIDLIGNQKTKLAFWIIDHLNNENQLVYTYDQIQKATGLSRDTIAKTMKALVESDFLQKKHSGCYIVNPDVIYKGKRNGRLNVLIRYNDTKVQAEIEERKKQEEKEEKTASDAPQAPQTVENASAGENVPTEEKKAQNQPPAAEMEKKVQLPQLFIDPDLSELVVPAIYQNRDELFNQFINQTTLFDDSDYTEKIRQIFLTEVSAEFWIKVVKLENLLSFHTEWKAQQDKKQ